MAIDVDADSLAAMCFRRVPKDVVARDVVLAALWHLYLKAAQAGLKVEGRTFRHSLLGKRAGLSARDYRAALEELQGDGLIGKANNGYCLTPRGLLRSASWSTLIAPWKSLTQHR